MARVLVCDNLDAAGVDRLRGATEVHAAGSLDEDALIEALRGCTALIVRSATRVTARVLEQAAGLRVVARAGVGVDNIDVAAATRHGVLVVNSPLGNVLAAAEHTLALLLAAARNVPQADSSMKAGEFDRKRFMGRQIAGKTLGIVGLGRIGSEVARRARALGMELLAHDPYVPGEQAAKLGARVAPLEEVLIGCDFLTVHVPATADTRGLIDAAALGRLRPHVIVINCARGGIVNEAALLEALGEHRLAGAALDVFEHEPTVNQELVSHPAVIATPHLGASTAEAQETVAIDAAEQVLDVLAGRQPRNPVNVLALAPELVAALAPFELLAAHLGRLANVLTTSAPSELAIEASAAAPLEGLPHLAGRLICAVLQGRIDHPLNDVNAMLVARERGIRVVHAITGDDHGYLRHLRVVVTFGGRACALAGAVIEGSQPRVLQIDGFTVDLVPAGQHLLVWKKNPHVPGFIGTIGTALAAAGVGITNIQVGGEEIADTGLLVARVDRPVPDAVRDALRTHPDVTRLELIVFDSPNS